MKLLSNNNVAFTLGRDNSSSYVIVDANSADCFVRCHDSWCDRKGHSPRSYNGNDLS